MLRHLYYFTHVGVRSGEARSALAGDPGLWLPPPAELVGDGWLVDLHASSSGVTAPIASQRAIVRVDPPLRGSERSSTRALTWRSHSLETLFPVLDADLELAHVAGELSQLTLLGSYHPPLSVVGDVGDRLLGHRVAEAVVRRFVEDVAVRLAGVAADAPE